MILRSQYSYYECSWCVHLQSQLSIRQRESIGKGVTWLADNNVKLWTQCVVSVQHWKTWYLLGVSVVLWATLTTIFDSLRAALVGMTQGEGNSHYNFDRSYNLWTLTIAAKNLTVTFSHPGLPMVKVASRDQNWVLNHSLVRAFKGWLAQFTYYNIILDQKTYFRRIIT